MGKCHKCDEQGICGILEVTFSVESKYSHDCYKSNTGFHEGYELVVTAGTRNVLNKDSILKVVKNRQLVENLWTALKNIGGERKFSFRWKQWTLIFKSADQANDAKNIIENSLQGTWHMDVHCCCQLELATIEI